MPVEPDHFAKFILMRGCRCQESLAAELTRFFKQVNRMASQHRSTRSFHTCRSAAYNDHLLLCLYLGHWELQLPPCPGVVDTRHAACLCQEPVDTTLVASDAAPYVIDLAFLSFLGPLRITDKPSSYGDKIRLAFLDYAVSQVRLVNLGYGDYRDRRYTLYPFCQM